LCPEESALLETMAILVQAYDDRHHPLPSVAPNEMLAYLMETSGRTAKDLLPVLGTRGRVSEVLNGKRSISREQAKKLASVLKVAVDLFIQLAGQTRTRLHWSIHQKAPAEWIPSDSSTVAIFFRAIL